ncbi:MAG TPA: alginate lyase family protein [Blastocatellia bacterium]
MAYRLGYAARMRMGLVRRRTPATDWNAQPLETLLSDGTLAEPRAYLDYRRKQAPAFFFDPRRIADYQRHFTPWDEGVAGPVIASDELAQGWLRYFEHESVQAGFPPDWHANPFTGEKVSAEPHWSRIGHFDDTDIKVIWEPSRFGFAYTLVRAYWRAKDDRYAEIFWRLVEDWRERNPPQHGPNWNCGQEISFRVMGWCFGLYGFLHAPATGRERVAALAQMVALSGLRIEANLDYALSQHNNHGISEGVGLWTAGALFPEFDSAERWKDRGRSVLESAGRELIYDDGSFSQHSANYHRLMLHDYLWALRLGEILDLPFSRELKERVGAAGRFLFGIQDEQSGRVPNYGHNDGALILPLSNSDYQDYRPVVQATHYLSKSARCYPPGPWDEDLLWLFGPDALDAPLDPQGRSDLRAEVGGYYSLRSRTGFVFVRCASFRHRPGQADMLHADVWWRGQNIALDAGTYSYNAPAPWNNSLAGTAYHNTVTVDGLDQMGRAGKFLWLPWLRSRLRQCRRSRAGHLSYWEGEHNGYERLKFPVTHRRAILSLGDECWLILDGLNSREEHLYRLHWLFHDLPFEWGVREGLLSLDTPAGAYSVGVGSIEGDAVYSLVRADENSPRGWRAPYYNHCEPALSLDVTARAKSHKFWTLFAPEACRVVSNNTSLGINARQWQASIDLAGGEKALIASARLSRGIAGGEVEDILEIA